MGKRSNIDFASLTVEQVARLNTYQYERYKLWLQTKRRKNEIKTDFLKQFQKSCEKYKD